MTNPYNGAQRIVCLTAETAQDAVAIQAGYVYEITSSSELLDPDFTL